MYLPRKHECRNTLIMEGWLDECGVPRPIRGHFGAASGFRGILQAVRVPKIAQLILVGAAAIFCHSAASAPYCLWQGTLEGQGQTERVEELTSPADGV